jgi:glycosyltransferase involved in cell wall biosynthesis
VVHFHGPWALESQAESARSISIQAKKLIETAVYRRADRIIVLSKAFGILLQNRYNIASAKLRYIQGGVDCDRFLPKHTRTEARAILGWHTCRPTLFTVRRLTRRMGLDRLIDAMAQLRQSRKDAILYIAGIGPERKTLESRVASLGLSNNVIFLGLLPDEMLPIAYRAADLTVVPTLTLEGFGLIVLESLATGTPAMVTPVGGLPEVVAGLSPSLIFEDNGAQAIADGIESVLTGSVHLPDENACRHHARQNFDWPKVSARVATVYNELA